MRHHGLKNRVSGSHAVRVHPVLIAAAIACAAAWGSLATGSARPAPRVLPLPASLEQAVQSGALQPDPQTIIDVARDVSPELLAMLEQARASDPVAFNEAVARAGKRLTALAVLRVRKPALYALRIEEIRVQGEIEEVGSAWLAQRGSGDEAAALQSEARVRELAGSLVDLNLRSRGLELAEIDAVVRAMRTDLERDARQRDATVDQVVTGVREGRQEALLGGRTAFTPTPPSSPAVGGAPSSVVPSSGSAPNNPTP